MTIENVTPGAVQRVVNDKDWPPPAERSGPAIVRLLQQAAELAQRNEERFRTTALRLGEEIRALEERNRLLEARVQELVERAARAEQWLMHIHQGIHAHFVDGRAAENADRSGARASPAQL